MCVITSAECQEDRSGANVPNRCFCCKDGSILPCRGHTHLDVAGDGVLRDELEILDGRHGAAAAAGVRAWSVVGGVRCEGRVMSEREAEQQRPL